MEGKAASESGMLDAMPHRTPLTCCLFLLFLMIYNQRTLKESVHSYISYYTFLGACQRKTLFL